MAITITFSRATTPIGSVTVQGTSFGSAEPLKFVQPQDRSNGGTLYSYTKGINDQTYLLILQNMPEADYQAMKTFFRDVTNGAQFPFSYLDNYGVAHNNCILLTQIIDWPVGEFGRSGQLLLQQT